MSWRLQQLRSDGSENPAQVLSTARNAIRRVRMVMRGLPQRELTEEGKRLIGSIQHEAAQQTKEVRLRCACSNSSSNSWATSTQLLVAAPTLLLRLGSACMHCVARAGPPHETATAWLLTTASCCCRSDAHGPTRNQLTSQFLTPAEMRQILQHCYRRGDRQGLMLAAMLSRGVYNGFR